MITLLRTVVLNGSTSGPPLEPGAAICNAFAVDMTGGDSEGVSQRWCFSLLTEGLFRPEDRWEPGIKVNDFSMDVMLKGVTLNFYCFAGLLILLITAFIKSKYPHFW
jgi:hypothetical protein